MNGAPAVLSLRPDVSQALAFLAMLRFARPGPGDAPRTARERLAGCLPLRQVPSLRQWRGDRLPMPGMLGAAVSRGSAGRPTEALTILGLIISRAPADVRARFREQLRSFNLADPGDPSAPPNAARSWSRPDLYAAAAATVLPDLGEPEQALAAAAIGTLSAPARERRARARSAEDVSAR